MSEYYILNGSEQQGPYTIDQLRGRVTAQTYVWREGLADWVQAINLPELSGLLVPEGAVPVSYTHLTLPTNSLV